MARVLKIHLLRPEPFPSETKTSMCGIVTESITQDPELITCQHCSGFYRTNMEWYSQVKNRVVEGRGRSGEGDLYTRQDLEAGLARLGWSDSAIAQVLNFTQLFRNIPLGGDSLSERQERLMGVHVHPNGKMYKPGGMRR